MERPLTIWLLAGCLLYGLGCTVTLFFFFRGSVPQLNERVWPWPVIFLWPLLLLWPLRKFFSRREE